MNVVDAACVSRSALLNLGAVSHNQSRPRHNNQSERWPVCGLIELGALLEMTGCKKKG